MDKSDKQMSFLFEEGGIADDGMDRDPVSGNEVPPGSMAEEVRDDIPAQLSEGEYVVPADVVRYFGVKFFEDLRSQAKQGLGDMEANGRIGGEPVPPGGPMQGEGELSPEEMAALQEVMGVAVGGYIPNQPTQSTMYDPYMQQQAMYAAPVARGNVGFAEGGDTTEADLTAPTYTAPDLASQFPLGFSFTDKAVSDETPIEETTFETVTLYGPNGEIVTVTLPTDQARYDQLLAEGYSTEPTTAMQQEREGRDMSDEEAVAPGDWAKELNIENVTGWASEQLGLSKGEKFLGAMGLAGKGAVGLSQATSVAQTRGLAQVAAAQGNTALANQLNAMADETVQNSNILGFLDNMGWLTGNAYAKSATTAGVDLSGGKPSTTPSVVDRGSKAPSAAQVQAEKAMGLDPFGGAGRDVSTSSGVSAAQAAEAAAAGVAAGVSPAAAAEAAAAGATSIGTGMASTAAEVGKGEDYSGPFNKGGFVSRRNKKKK